jgi:hypothetical protein
MSWIPPPPEPAQKPPAPEAAPEPPPSAPAQGPIPSSTSPPPPTPGDGRNLSQHPGDRTDLGVLAQNREPPSWVGGPPEAPGAVGFGVGRALLMQPPGMLPTNDPLRGASRDAPGSPPLEPMQRDEEPDGPCAHRAEPSAPSRNPSVCTRASRSRTPKGKRPGSGQHPAGPEDQRAFVAGAIREALQLAQQRREQHEV